MLRNNNAERRVQETGFPRHAMHYGSSTCTLPLVEVLQDGAVRVPCVDAIREHETVR